MMVRMNQYKKVWLIKVIGSNGLQFHQMHPDSQRLHHISTVLWCNIHHRMKIRFCCQSTEILWYFNVISLYIQLQPMYVLNLKVWLLTVSSGHFISSEPSPQSSSLSHSQRFWIHFPLLQVNSSGLHVWS